MVVMLPTKPSSPPGETEPGAGRTTTSTTQHPVQTPVPVRVTPVVPDSEKPSAPTEPGKTAVAAKTGPEADNPGSSAPATNPPGPGTEPDEPDDPDPVGTSGKPGKATREEHRAAAKAARAAARAAAKAAKAAEADTAPPQAPLKSLTQDVLRQNMLRAESRFKSCAKEAWGSYVTISILVDNSGSVQKADLIGPLGTSATGRCISEQIRKQHFPPFTEGSSKQFVWSYQIPAAN